MSEISRVIYNIERKVMVYWLAGWFFTYPIIMKFIKHRNLIIMTKKQLFN